MCMTEFCGSSDYCNKCINNPNGDKRKMKNERKDELKDEMKNRISLALKDPILQQGFEIICKENEILKGRTEEFEKQILGLLYKYESVYKRFPDLKDAMNKAESILKENAELKDYNKKLLQSDIDKQNKIVLLSKKVNDLQKKNVGQKDELNKAKVIINKWLRVYNTNTTKEVIKESEDFLKEIKSL